MGELAMFPLQAVLLPGMALPLHVFEPRYRALMDDCLAGDREFGVALIQRIQPRRFERAALVMAAVSAAFLLV